MARYLVLIYGNERTWADLPAEWHAANAERHQALIAAAGPAIRGVYELEPTSHAVSIRAGVDGQPSVTQDPSPRRQRSSVASTSSMLPTSRRRPS